MLVEERGGPAEQPGARESAAETEEVSRVEGATDNYLEPGAVLEESTAETRGQVRGKCGG